MRRTILSATACVALLCVGTAQAATDEEKCLAGRAKAKGKYEQCVAGFLSNVYGTGVLDIAAEEKVAKCRINYAAAWTKLQGIAVAPDHESHDRSVNRSGGTHSCYRAVPSWSAHQPRLYTRTDYQPIQRVLEKRTRRASSGSGRGPKGAA